MGESCNKKVFYAHLYDNDVDKFLDHQAELSRAEQEKQAEINSLENIVDEWRKQTKKLASDYQVGGDHYKKQGVQPWDIIDQYSLNFYAGNVIKYLLRYQFKNGLEDLQKAEHYIKRLIEIEKEKS